MRLLLCSVCFGLRRLRNFFYRCGTCGRFRWRGSHIEAGVHARRLPIRVEILEVLSAGDARLRSRELIAGAVGEPLAP